MESARLPSAAVGNGRLLVTLSNRGEVLTACWPCIDSPNQLGAFHVVPVSAAPSSDLAPRFNYVEDTNIFAATTAEGLTIQDTVVDLTISAAGATVDGHVRRIIGPHPDISIYLAPELDGRPNAQTIYWDEEAEALIAHSRHNYLVIAVARGEAVDFHCGRCGDESSALHFLAAPGMPGERLAFRAVDGAIRRQASRSDTLVWAIHGPNRETVLEGLHMARSLGWAEVEALAVAAASRGLSEIELATGAGPIDRALRRTSLVMDVLTNRDTGGAIAGPNVQSGIASAPDYAAVWGRDAAWTALGALALGRHGHVRQMLRFALATQAPEGIWLQRHHTDRTVAPSWGSHQIDETGLILHAIGCYVAQTNDVAFAHESWRVVERGADFLCGARDATTGLPIKSVCLWEEREGFHAYSSAAVSGGIKAAASLATRLGRTEQAVRWSATARSLDEAILARFWRPELNRFVKSLQASPALPIVDPERPDLPTNVQSGAMRPETAIGRYPNWRATETIDVDFAHDLSILGLAVPFGVLAVDDPRIVSTVAALRATLWNKAVGGMRRYEGDSYGGGNVWPLATLWLAIYEGTCGNSEIAQELIEWVVGHSTDAGLVPEQVHREHGHPVAAVPLSWSHGMIAIAVAAQQGRQVWQLPVSGG